MRQIKFYSFLIFLFASSICHAHLEYSLKQGQQSRWLADGFQYYIDTNQSFFITNWQSIPFEKNSGAYSNFGSVKYPVWCLVKVNTQPEESTFLMLDYPLIDSLQVFILDSLGHVSVVYKTGSHTPFESRPIYDNLFRFKIPSGSHQVLIRAQSQLDLLIAFKLINQEGVNKELYYQDVWQSIYIGIVILALISTLLIGLFTQTRVFYAYIGHLIGTALITLHLGGYAYMYIWPQNPEINQYEPLIFGLGIFSTLFSMEFLNTKLRAPVFHKLLWASVGANFLVFPIAILGFISFANQLVQMVGLLGCLLMLIAGINIYLKGYRPARFFILAWSIFLLGVITTILQRMAIIPYNSLTLHASQVGSALDIFLFFMALADKVLYLKNERDEANNQMLITVQQNTVLINQKNERLNQKVQERTQELEKQNKRLEELNERQKKLLNIIGHDLRGPIGSISQGLELMIEDSKLRNDEFIAMLSGSAKNSYSTLQNLLNWALSQNKNKKLNSTPIQLSTVASDLKTLFGSTLKQKKITLKLEVPEEYILNTDKELLNTICRNLLNNAIKFSPVKGSIIFKALADEKELEISIQDFGPGISPNQLKKLKEQNTSVSTLGTLGETGTGLGLTVVREFTALLGARFSISSPLNGGTIARVSFLNNQLISNTQR